MFAIYIFLLWVVHMKFVMLTTMNKKASIREEGRSLGGKISGGRGRPPANILIPLERQLNALQLCC